MIAGPSRKRSSGRLGNGAGRAQLSLVEHALCPLDPAASLVPNLVHTASYTFTDRNGHAKEARAQITSPFGLSASDELILWGLLALTFSQDDPQPEFQATPHYCLRQLGIITDKAHRGGKQYQLFRDAIRHLSGVVYENTAFFDPIRGEHRQVAFGFLKYSLPINPESSRTWRLLWDQQFFEICKASGGSFHFDLSTYRSLDHASRRLFVLLQKIFWRNDVSPAFDVARLTVATLGFSVTMPVKDLKLRLIRCAERLLEAGIIRLPPEASSVRDLMSKRGVGQYTVTFHRGIYFDRPEATRQVLSEADSPLIDPLRAIGFEDAVIRRMLRTYKPTLLQTWADITLAARERNGDEFFRKSAAAYFLDNVKHAAKGTRTAPDWWRQLRVEELRRAEDRPTIGISPSAGDSDAAFRRYLESDARDAFHAVLKDLRAKLTAAGSDARDAEEKATVMAIAHLRNRFRQDHPAQATSSGPVNLAELMKRTSR